MAVVGPPSAFAVARPFFVRAHLAVGVPFRDQPHSETRRHIFDHSLGQTVEANAVDLLFPRRFLYADFHLIVA
jgi:hypothetical protein